MKLVGIIEEDFTQYKVPVMFINTPYCDFKCDRECGKSVCQNSELAHAKHIEISSRDLIERYLNNPITKAIVFGGMDPLYKSFYEVREFIQRLRTEYHCLDDIVIYTGYTEEEVEDLTTSLKDFPNIIIKYGRYKYDLPERFDSVLGITLASNNQYAKRIS